MRICGSDATAAPATGSVSSGPDEEKIVPCKGSEGALLGKSTRGSKGESEGGKDSDEAQEREGVVKVRVASKEEKEKDDFGSDVAPGTCILEWKVTSSGGKRSAEASGARVSRLVLRSIGDVSAGDGRS